MTPTIYITQQINQMVKKMNTENTTQIKLDALGQVDIVASYKGQNFHGIGLSTDIIESSALALVHVMNHIHLAKEVELQKKQRLQTDQV